MRMEMSKIKAKFAKYKITNNLGLKIASLVLAIIVWLIVVNVGDPVTTKVFKGVPVVVLHEEFLTEEGKVYQVLEDTNVVNITVRARRSVLKSIKETDFSVTADMRELVFMESVRIAVTCEKYEDKIDAIYQNHDTMLVAIEENETREFTVEFEAEGTPAEGYTVGKCNMKPEKIAVSGPKSVVSKVDRIVARVNVDGASDIIEEAEVIPVLYDADGNGISDSQLTLSSNNCMVSVPIWSTKSVAVEVLTSGQVAKGYSYDKISCYPSAIVITGEDDILKNVTKIVVPENVVDITGATSDVEKKINIKSYLPEGIYLVDESSAKITVTVGVSSQVSEEYAIGVDKIGLVNAPEDYKVSFGDLTEFTVVLRGTRSELEQISDASIKCTMNLSGYGPGSHQVPLEFVVSGNVEVVGQVQLMVNIQEKTKQNTNGADPNVH